MRNIHHFFTRTGSDSMFTRYVSLESTLKSLLLIICHIYKLAK